MSYANTHPEITEQYNTEQQPEHCEACDDTGLIEEEHFCSCEWGDMEADHHMKYHEEPMYDEE